MDYCKICEKNFSNRRSLLKHNRRVHNVRVGRPKSCYECSECSFQCLKKKDILCHVKVHVCRIERGKRLICPKCNKTVQRYADLRVHITNVHNVELITEKITFDNEEDFIKWKRDIEEDQLSSYVLNCGNKRMLDGSTLRYFVCHRSYEFRSRITNKRKRRLKSSGTYKTGKACPAGFSVKKYADGKIVVEVCSTHIGHSQGLGDVFLSQEDRDQIAGKLQEGEEVERILNDMRDFAVIGHIKRVHLLERKDILNIKQNLGCTARRHEDDSTSVDLLVDYI